MYWYPGFNLWRGKPSHLIVIMKNEVKGRRIQKPKKVLGRCLKKIKQTKFWGSGDLVCTHSMEISHPKYWHEGKITAKPITVKSFWMSLSCWLHSTLKGNLSIRQNRNCPKVSQKIHTLYWIDGAYELTGHIISLPSSVPWERKHTLYQWQV